MLFEQFGQQSARGVPFAIAVPVFGLNAIVDRLAKQRLRLLLADDVDKVPGAIGEDDAMDLGGFLHGLKEGVERFVGGDVGECRESLIRLVGILAVNGITE